VNSSLRAERTTNVKAIVSEPITGLTGSCLRLPPFHFSNPGQVSGDRAPSLRRSEGITPGKLLEFYMFFLLKSVGSYL